uniref:Fibronectin type-III domain-containing protein n=1 Tax=Romanomermis culicivorax TaxID=13658 RepID=A0A915K3T7_ROMCU
MRSVNRAGFSSWSPSVDIVTCEGIPGPVRDLIVKPLSPNEVLVSWLPPAEKTGQILGYDVSMRLKHRLACVDEKPRDVSQAWFTVYNVKDLKYTLTGLLPFVEYEVKVRARGTTVGPEEVRLAQTHQQAPSAPPLDLKASYVLERSLGINWQPVECSQRHGYINNYEYEVLGQDNWAKLEVRVANTSQLKVDIDGLTPHTKYIVRVKAYNSVGGGPATADLELMSAKAAAPLPPQDLSVMAEGANFIAVSWLPPYPPYGPIDSYKLRYAKDNKKFIGNIENLDWMSSNNFPKNDQLIKCPHSTAEMPRMCYNITGLESGAQYRIQ